MRKVLEAVSKRMIAAEDDPNVADAMVEYIANLPRPIGKDIRRLVILFEWLPALVIFRPARFSRLSVKDQDRYIEAWGTSRLGLLRTGFRVLKGLSVSIYYQNPQSWRGAGFEQ